MNRDIEIICVWQLNEKKNKNVNRMDVVLFRSSYFCRCCSGSSILFSNSATNAYIAYEALN